MGWRLRCRRAGRHPQERSHAGADGPTGRVQQFLLPGRRVVGAVVFGYGTDRLGRKKLFYVTLLVYLAATAATAFSWNFASYAFFRLLTGAGIGGEYAAINSAVDELIPARVRGRADLIINSTYWVGAALGAAATVVLLDPHRLPMWLGWRLRVRDRRVAGAGGVVLPALGAGKPALADGTRTAPKRAKKWSPTWSNAVTADQHPDTLPPLTEPKAKIRQRTHTPWREIWRAVAYEHRRSSFLGLALMIAQAFFLQRHLFHLCAGAGEILRGACRPAGLVSGGVRARQRAGTRADGPPLRFGRTQADDRRDLRAVRGAAGHHGLVVPPGAC